MLKTCGDVDDSDGRVADVEADDTIFTELFCVQEGGQTRWPSTSIEKAPKNLLMSIVTSYGICSVKKLHICQKKKKKNQ